MIQSGIVASVDRVKPAVAITNPAQSSTQSGTINLQVSSSDNDKIASVQFYLDGSAYGGAVTGAPFQIALNTAALSSGGHSCYAIARDRVGNLTQSATVSFNAADQHPPSVSIYSPGNGATVTGTITFGASPSDDVGISYVQFNVDGSGWTGAIGSPYQMNYDTHNLGVGWHTLYCLATDTSNNQTQTSISFYVNNQPPGGGYIDMGSFVHSDGGVDRWTIDFYPNFNPEGGYIDHNGQTLPGNPNPTYYNMRARIYCHQMESPRANAYQYIGLWLDGSRYPNGPNQQISSQNGQNDQYGPYFGVGGGNYCWVERWGDAQDGAITWIIRIHYDFTPKYAS
jgi:hypothetical protein